MAVDIVFLILFIVFSIAHLIGEIVIYANKEKAGLIIRYITKPLLMPLVAVYYIMVDQPFLCGFIIAGIFFGFIGDLLLMLSSPEKRKISFMVGLIAYPISHLFYITAFLFNFISRVTIYEFHYWTLGIIIPIILLGVLAGIKILPKAEKMKVPMLVNIIILVIMGLAATLFFYSPELALKGSITLIVGIFVYMFSVLIYAWNNYVKQIPYERLIKMSTYLLGLFLIVQGFIWAVVGL
ncbi:MAG: lysoplasmalogenase [Asgard group archaeon]|nr:lysoplasmalogenase [Asgard group archaeon]